MHDSKAFHDKFYSTTNKIEQDKFILKFISVHSPKRERTKKVNSSRKGVAINYYVMLRDTTNFKVQVYQNAFLNILHVSKDRVQRIGRNFLNTGLLPTEKRGGSKHKPIYVQRRNSVKQFIEKLACSEVHYCREKSNRQYLPCDLSIKKLFNMYNNQVPDESLKVKRTFFRNIFCLEYNVGFGTPATDTCSKCSSLTQGIKKEKDQEVRQKLQIEMRVHMLKSKAFYTKLREECPNMITFSFDCQKNLVNPKVQDQIAYYSRQLYTYNFAVVKGSSHTKLTKENVYCYTWMEHEYHKGSNEIASAIFHVLSSTDLSPYEKIRLCADGCGGQNRNSTMIAMLIYFLGKHAPPNIKQVELVFPVRGHSFLPSDRVFGVIEKKLKKLPIITDPQVYTKIFEEVGTVKVLAECEVKNWKEAATTYLKNVQSWHFKFSTAKRFLIERTRGVVTVTGEEHYTANIGEAKSVFKRGRRLEQMTISEVKKGVIIKSNKVEDIRKLLIAHFGQKWLEMEELAFFRNFLRDQERQPNENEDSENVEFCEGGQEENDSLRV